MRYHRVSTLFLLAALAGCTGKYIRKTTDYRVASTPERIARGKYLVDGPAACGGCHTPRVGGDDLAEERSDAYLAGGQLLQDTRAGYKLLVPNITPDKETGIGGWTDDQIRRAIRDGVDDGGHFLDPLMPYGTWGRMSDEDVDSIVAYLRSIPPIHNAVDTSHQKHGKAGIAMKLGMVQHKPAGGIATPSSSDKVAYGRYLATGIAVCWACHSLTSTGPKESHLFSGSTVAFTEPATGKVWAPNLTPDPETGIGKASDAEVKAAIRNCTLLSGGRIARPMSDDSAEYARITDADLDAIVAYLRSLPPKKHAVPTRQLTPRAAALFH